MSQTKNTRTWLKNCTWKIWPKYARYPKDRAPCSEIKGAVVMTECLCDLEKVVDPHCCAAGMCTREKEMAIERAELGIDGNCGFALVGENLQEGGDGKPR
jgi:hypothetical protein